MSKISKEVLIMLSAFTGVMLVPSGEFSCVHKFIEETLNRRVLIHEMAREGVWKELRDALGPVIESMSIKAFEEDDDAPSP